MAPRSTVLSHHFLLTYKAAMVAVCQVSRLHAVDVHAEHLQKKGSAARLGLVQRLTHHLMTSSGRQKSTGIS